MKDAVLIDLGGVDVIDAIAEVACLRVIGGVGLDGDGPVIDGGDDGLLAKGLDGLDCTGAGAARAAEEICNLDFLRGEGGWECDGW